MLCWHDDTCTAWISKLEYDVIAVDAVKHINQERTIEADAQQAAYDGLAGRKGAVVVLDADTGAVLAMVSAPAYDPNNVEDNWKAMSQEADGPLLNRTVQGLYPPGSTIKPMIADAALTDGVTNEQETFDCPGILDVGGGHSIRESHGEVHNRVDLRKALTESCNVTFGTLGMRLGDDKLKKALKARRKLMGKYLKHRH